MVRFSIWIIGRMVEIWRFRYMIRLFIIELFLVVRGIDGNRVYRSSYFVRSRRNVIGIILVICYYCLSRFNGFSIRCKGLVDFSR